MGYTFKQCPPKSECALKIYYGGKWKNNVYTGKRVIWVDIESKTASLAELKDIASKLGYQDTQLNFSFKSPTTQIRVDVNSDDDVTQMIEQMPYSRDLEFYIDGVRKKEKSDEFPTILFWNCRGLGKSAIDLLKVLIAIYDPTIIFLIETRMSSKVIQGVSSSLRFQNVGDFPSSRGGAGIPNCVGLAMLMKRSVNVDYLDKTANYLDFVITMKSTGEEWRLTGFYGHPKVKDRSWKWLRKLNRDINLPWIIFGDFNEILDANEKFGGPVKDPNKIGKFNKVVNECRLLNLPFEGSRFTWKRNNIMQRLDRVLVTEEWIKLFPIPRVLHLAGGDISDHVPIVIQTNGEKHKAENSEPLTQSLTNVLSFAKELEKVYIELISHRRFTTISNIAKEMKHKRPNFYFEVAKTIAPEVIHTKHIVVHDKTTGAVKFDREVRLKSCCDISNILWNCIVLTKSNPDDHVQVAPDYPSDCCTHIIEEEVNLSGYLAQAWELLPLIPADGKSPQDIIEKVHEKIDEQVDDMIKRLTNLFSKVGDGVNIGKKEHKDMDAGLKLQAEIASRAVILYKTIISLIRERKMASKGKIEDIEGVGGVRPTHYVPAKDEDEFMRKLQRQFVEQPLKDLLATFKWKVDDTRYEIDIVAEEDRKHLDTLEGKRFEAEKTWMLWKNLSGPLMTKINESGGYIEIQNLADVVRDSFKAAKPSVQDQIDLLTKMKILRLDSNDGKLYFVDANRSPQFIMQRLKQAAATALKSLENSTSDKPVKYNTYIKRITSAYKKRRS